MFKLQYTLMSINLASTNFGIFSFSAEFSAQHIFQFYLIVVYNGVNHDWKNTTITKLLD